jgi:hypothetical protein
MPPAEFANAFIERPEILASRFRPRGMGGVRSSNAAEVQWDQAAVRLAPAEHIACSLNDKVID